MRRVYISALVVLLMVPLCGAQTAGTLEAAGPPLAAVPKPVWTYNTGG